MLELPQLPKRPPDAHKGDFGRVLVVAGSKGMIGACELCCKAALRTGSGLVLALTPRECYHTLATKLTCGMIKPMRQTPTGGLALGAWKEIARIADDFDVVALGPGIGRHRSTQALVSRLIETLECPIVLDADALFAVAADSGVLKRTTALVVVTPHAGEMARLTGRSTDEIAADREGIATAFAKDNDVTVVLKGRRTVISFGGMTATNPSGNPGMATAGSGDVLTGVIAALIGQLTAPFDAARLGAYLHGRAGDIAAKLLGEASVTAVDILEALPGAIKQFEKSGPGKSVGF